MTKSYLFFLLKKERQLELLGKYYSISSAIKYGVDTDITVEALGEKEAKKLLLKKLYIVKCFDSTIIVHDEIDFFNLIYYLKVYKNARIKFKVEYQYCLVYLNGALFSVSVY